MRSRLKNKIKLGWGERREKNSALEVSTFLDKRRHLFLSVQTGVSGFLTSEIHRQKENPGNSAHSALGLNVSTESLSCTPQFSVSCDYFVFPVQ